MANAPKASALIDATHFVLAIWTSTVAMSEWLYGPNAWLRLIRVIAEKAMPEE
ncbi:MAG TPA: hypothetical protein VGW39_00235 [Chthoniobacterales bacterium]|nr:hypothetical protein [Chthoniobacterales bacterium]